MNQLDEKTMTYLETRIPELAEGVRGSRSKEKDCFIRL